ncbi:MAG: nuclear transport factor 2 family protein [Planctomycetota bacterium]|nr:nuclear transport factor 2 family protein [Planctomycetota bacterium]
MLLRHALLAGLCASLACHAPMTTDGTADQTFGQALDEATAVGAVLDDLHLAAAEADGPRYFDHYTDDAVFLGTDRTERWPMAEFRAFAEPYFERGQAWTYVPTFRHVELQPGTEVPLLAWFDEELENESYGTVRGSGVLVRASASDPWRVSQYVLSFPVPNEVAKDLVELIRAASADDPSH